MQLTKAHIELIDAVANVPKKLSVMFNPTEYTLTQGSQIAEISIPGIASPVLQFVRGQNRKLTVDLLFDATDAGMGQGVKGIEKQVTDFLKLGAIEPNLHAPPRLKFVWGSLQFTSIIESIQQKYTLFSPEGKWLRATLSVTFREYKSLQTQLKELNLQSADHSKRYTVQRGDTLPQIAFEMYGDAGEWRPIAQQNNLTNPRDLVPGSTLAIPPLDTFVRTRIS